MMSASDGRGGRWSDERRCDVLLPSSSCYAGIPAARCADAALERGAAITDPLALRELELGEHPASGLDQAKFSLRPFMAPAGSAAPILNDELFALPSMAPVRCALDNEFDRYVARHVRGPATRNAARPRRLTGRCSIAFALFRPHTVRAGGHRQPDGPGLWGRPIPAAKSAGLPAHARRYRGGRERDHPIADDLQNVC